ncbi:MAG: hypothetical protein LLG44_09140, partial [Chloroflexi bacterium]|nr:hypothetical protein [Chloroflexota bacterium]
LGRGCTWNQQLVIDDAGTREAWCELGAYGSGPRPRIIRNGDAMERCIRLTNPSFWKVRDLELGNCGCALWINFTTPGHEGLVLEDLFVHDCYGIFIRDMPEGPARKQARLDHIGIAAAINISCDNMELQPGEVVLKDVYIDGIEGCHNADSLAIAPAGKSVREEVSYPMRDIILNHLYLHDDDAPNPGGIPDSLRFVRCEHVLLINSVMHNCCGQFTTSGTAMMFMGGIKDLLFVNNTFTHTPDSGSVDQCAIDFEATTRQVKIRNNYFGQNAGPGIEFLDIWGESSYSEGHEVSGNAFEGNGWSSRGGQAGAGGIHHYGGNFATGVIRDNLVYEPGRPLYHGEFVKFKLVNNIQAAGPLYNAMHGFSSTQGADGWRCQVREAGGAWRDAERWSDEQYAWVEGAMRAWLNRMEQCTTSPDLATARVWQAPRDGAVTVRSRAVKFRPASAPATVQITLNGQPLCAAAVVPAGDWNGIELNLQQVQVKVGDLLRFEACGAGNDAADALSWAPTVAYIG